jgi:hypothetical protein
MCQGDYVFLSPDLLPASTVLNTIFDTNTEEGATLKQAYFPLLEVCSCTFIKICIVLHLTPVCCLTHLTLFKIT